MSTEDYYEKYLDREVLQTYVITAADVKNKRVSVSG